MIGKYLILGLACLTRESLAHRALEDEDSYLQARDTSDLELDKSGLKANYERQVDKYPLLHKFSDESAPRARGTLLVTRNAKT